MRIKCTLKLSPCNYSVVMLQICHIPSAAPQHFQILPKEKITVFNEGSKVAGFGTSGFHPLLSQVHCDCCCSTKT